MLKPARSAIWRIVGLAGELLADALFVFLGRVMLFYQ